MRSLSLLLMCLLVVGVSHAALRVDTNGGLAPQMLLSYTVDVVAKTATRVGWEKDAAITGSVTDGSGTFTFAHTAASNWNTSLAQAAIDAGTFGSYLSGLTQAGVGTSQGRPGVDGAGADNVNVVDSSGEVMVLTFTTTNLVNKLAFKGFIWDSVETGDKMDYLVYDSSKNVIVQADYDVYPRDVFNPVLAEPNSWTYNRVVETGDKIILAWRAGSWRLAKNNFYDVDKLNLAAHSPIPTGPRAVILTEPGTVNLSWYSPEQLESGVFVDDPNYVVDQFDLRVVVNPTGEPNFAAVSPVQSSLAQSYALSGLYDLDDVYWRVDTTVTFDSNEVNGEPLTQVFEGDVWSFTASADPAPQSVNAGNDYVTWPNMVVPINAVVTDAGASNVTVTFAPTDPNMVIYAEDGVTVLPKNIDGKYYTVIVDTDKPQKDLPVNVKAITDWDNGDPGDVVVTIEASDTANPGEFVNDSMTIIVYSNPCRATRLGGGVARMDTDLVIGEDTGSGCKIDLVDLAYFAADWLEDYNPTAAIELD